MLLWETWRGYSGEMAAQAQNSPSSDQLLSIVQLLQEQIKASQQQSETASRLASLTERFDRTAARWVEVMHKHDERLASHCAQCKQCQANVDQLVDRVNLILNNSERKITFWEKCVTPIIVAMITSIGALLALVIQYLLKQ